MSFADEYSDIITVRALAIERLIANYGRRLDKQIDSAIRDLKRALLDAPELTEVRGRQLNKIIEEVVSNYNLTPPNLAEIQEAESNYIFGILLLLFAKYDLGEPRKAKLDNAPVAILGATIDEWFQKATADARFNFARSIKRGVVDQLTNTQIIESTIGNRRSRLPQNNDSTKSRNDLQNILRTGIQSAASFGGMSAIAANESVIAGYEHVSVLDSRTTVICYSRDGSVWDTNGNHISGPKNDFRIPPLHFNCRSRLVPVLIEGNKLAPTNNFDPLNSIDGLSESQKESIFGKGRYELFKNGKITLNQLLDRKSIRPISLSQLNQ